MSGASVPDASPAPAPALAPASQRSPAWRWTIIGVLFAATVVNYLDRQTLSNVSKRIKVEFDINNEQYGNLELAFGLAFAAGGPIFGLIADRVNTYWVYPFVLLAWSFMGFVTGWARNFEELMVCRILLGAFEAGHWPCALKTVQRVLPPSRRAFANSWLQAGTAIGAILAPIIILSLLTDEKGSWRFAFQIVGASGTAWVLLWFWSIRPADLMAEPPIDPPGERSISVPADDIPADQTVWQAVFSWRFLVMAILVVCINLNQHLFRVWLPLFLQEGRGYAEAEALRFNAAFFLAQDFGCLTAGWLALHLVGRGWSVFRARCSVYAMFCMLAAFTTAAALLPKGPLLLGSLLVVGAGILGVFPFYYSFAQDISVKHCGLVTGLLSMCAWVFPSIMHKGFGRYIDATQSYDLGIGVVGWMPLVALPFLLLLWNRKPKAPIAKEQVRA